eukprot:gene40301-54499_t
MTAIMCAFFAVVIGVNMLMASDAIRTFGGTVVDNSYVASQQYNGWLAEARVQRLYGWLTKRAVIRYFLRKTWGSEQIDEGLLDYDVLTTRQPNAKFAPYWFVSAYLFSADIIHLILGGPSPAAAQ